MDQLVEVRVEDLINLSMLASIGGEMIDDGSETFQPVRESGARIARVLGDALNEPEFYAVADDLEAGV